MELQGAAALVTGAGRGLGAALVAALAAHGARVVAVARNREEVEAVVAQVRQRGGQAHALVMDVADKASTLALAGAAQALVGPLDILVHNASSLGPVPLQPLLDTACEDLELALATNLVGPHRLNRAVVGGMALRGRGVVVHVSSDAAVNAYPLWGAYGASKAALDHLSRTLAAELEGRGVRVFSVDPGEMDTRMHAQAMPDANPALLARPQDVAARVVDMVAQPELAPHGARLCAQGAAS